MIKNFFLVALFIALPTFANTSPKIDIPFTSFKLDNGLTVVVHEDKKAPIVSVNMWYHVGSKDEKKGRTGFAHLFEHLMFNGSENYNDEFFGNADAGAMHFNFGQLIAHAARTRPLKAGTIIGSGTVSNEDMERGSSCLAEKRMLEKIHEGVIKTPFMKDGDKVKIEMFNEKNQNLFGTIEQKVIKVDV